MLLEVPTADDVLDLAVPADVRLTWLPRRRGAATHPLSALLGAAVRVAAHEIADSRAEPDDDDPDEVLWEVPCAPVRTGAYAWLAGEAGVVTGLRRHLLREAGVDRRSVAFMGYWRQGRPGLD